MTSNGVMKSRKDQKFWLRVMITSLIAAVVLAIIFSVTNYGQGQRRQEAINQLSSDYDHLRAQKIDLCALKANAAKPECLATGLPAKKIVKDTIEKTVLIPGTTGPQGPAGATPSTPFLTALVERAQALFCSDGRCTPIDGIDGESIVGPKGDSIQGPAGESIVGPSGKDGANGTNGSDGRGIASMTCNADGTWTITYDDSEGTTETVDGPCRVPVEPEPTPAPTPAPTP